MKSLIKTTKKSQWTQIKDLVGFTWTQTANLLLHLVSSFPFKHADPSLPRRPPPSTPQCDSVLGPSTKHCWALHLGVCRPLLITSHLQEVRKGLQIKLIRRVWPCQVCQELPCCSVPCALRPAPAAPGHQEGSWGIQA